jgi:hypothetical protein
MLFLHSLRAPRKPREYCVRHPLVGSIVLSTVHEGLSLHSGNSRDFQQQPPHLHRSDPGQKPSRHTYPNHDKAHQ